MKIYYKENMAKHTSFKIGGNCDVMVEPENVDEFVALIKYLATSNIIYYVLGAGTNLLVSDKGVRGLVIHLGEDMSKITVNGNKIEAFAGAHISDVAEIALNNGLTGFEQLSGIPGSIGGAVCMNAGAYGKEMADIVSSVNVLTEEGEIKTLKKDALNFSYRDSIIQSKKMIVMSVVISLQEGNTANIKEEMEKYKKLRWVKQPLEYPSAGSVFKRPVGYFASQLIEECNLKGEKVGGAMISTKHSGFIVNTNNAKAKDVYKLIEAVKKDIRMYYNIELETEIKLWGNF